MFAAVLPYHWRITWPARSDRLHYGCCYVTGQRAQLWWRIYAIVFDACQNWKLKIKLWMLRNKAVLLLSLAIYCILNYFMVYSGFVACIGVCFQSVEKYMFLLFFSAISHLICFLQYRQVASSVFLLTKSDFRQCFCYEIEQLDVCKLTKLNESAYNYCSSVLTSFDMRFSPPRCFK